MLLNKIEIRNFKSIENISFEFSKMKDNSFTYGLIGVNEAGKSSILKAIALKDEIITANPNDFRVKSKPIEIVYSYNLDMADIQSLKDALNKSSTAAELIDTLIHLENKDSIPELVKPSIKADKISQLSKLDKLAVEIKCVIDNAIPYKPNLTVEFKNAELKDGIYSDLIIYDYILQNSHKAIFWTSEEKYLISQPINLEKFAESPDSISIPLKNCFLLAGVSNIKERISLLSDPTEIEELQTELGEKVTEHINTVWSNHPIKITFVISSGSINFLIRDIGTKGKAKTAEQRSDGFKQFISFLLTISAQNKNQELSNSILLLDEPETHLHPQAQEYLLNELIEITKNDRKNIVLFATHSNYMIDKSDLGRNHQIKKILDKSTTKSFENKRSSYASVNYEVYEILSSDYHNELYANLYDKSECQNLGAFDDYLVAKGVEKNISYNHLRNGTQNNYNVTLPTKIRNVIHHPENTNNTFSLEELKHSIEKLIHLNKEI